MLTVNKLIAQGRGLAPVLLKRATQVQLPWDIRQKSRFDTTDSAGRHLGGGDVLVAEDGSLVQVQAAPEAVLVVRHCTEHGSPFDLLRAAYHLGNRHVALELQSDHLKLEPDHVLADLLRSMHLIVSEENAAFEPEAGAYAAEHGHGHGHGRSQDAHTDAAPASKKPLTIPIQAQAAAHVHGPGCGHDHHH
jgi:urease accessory protein